VDEGFIPRECRPDVQDRMAAGAWAVAYALAGRAPWPAGGSDAGDVPASEPVAGVAGAGEQERQGSRDAGTDRI